LTRQDVPGKLLDLLKQEFSYDNFWRLIAQKHCRRHGCWDNANEYAMDKLKKRYAREKDHWVQWGHDKMGLIKDDIGKFVSHRRDLANIKPNSTMIASDCSARKYETDPLFQSISPLLEQEGLQGNNAK
jgi:hypothetical protein